MADLTTRQTGPDAKGAPLTNLELDNNFINLKAESEGASAAAALAQSTADAAQGTADTALANAATAQAAADAAQADATQALANAATAQAAADAAQGTANTAVTNAATAQAAADAAQADATQALTNAATAQAAADAAQADATQALADAASGIGDAATAQAAADAAQARADAAHALATTAVANANTAQNAADAAQGDANTALTNAATAQSTADTALANAATAQSTANTAISNAATAQSTANTALTNAATAQSTADTALANAATAQAAAEAAQSTADDALAASNHTNRSNLDSIDQDMATTDVVTFDSVNTKHIHFNTTSGLVPYNEGTIGYDPVNKCLAIYNDQADITWQVGRENLMRVQNGTGTTLLNGRAVAVIAGGPVPVVGYATSADETSHNTVGILTQDIVAGGFGEVTVIGFVNDVDTSAYTGGAITWLSDDLPATGLLTTTQPLSPSYAVEMGGCLIQDGVNGVLYSRMIPRSNKEGLVDFYNGAILEDHSVVVTSDGSTVTLTLDAKNGRDFLSLLHEGDFHKLSVPATVTLSVGSDTAPVLNYIYIPHSTETLTAEVAIDWPVVEQITPIATCLVQSAASVQTDGAYKVHAWTDHITDTIGQGHLTHINKWIRKQNATWLEGTAMSFSGGGTATVEGAVTSGYVLQLHQQSFPALLNPMYFNVINDSVTPYIERTNLATILADSTGATLAGRAFSLVFWGVANQSESDCKIMCNLPSGSYSRTSPNLAAADADKFANYGIPNEYKGVGFLIKRLVCSYNVAGTLLTLHEDTYDGDDLRGSLPGTTGGGGGTGTSGNLPAGGADTFVLVKQSAIDYDATWVDPDVIRASVTDSTLTGDGTSGTPLGIDLDGAYAQELTAVPRTVHFVYGGSSDGGATPDATTQVSIDALVALSIPLSNIRWIYTA